MRLTSTSRLNIALHLVPVAGFSYFAYLGGDSFFGGMMATLVLFILVDFVACIKARIQGK